MLEEEKKPDSDANDSDATQIYEAAHVEDLPWEENVDGENVSKENQPENDVKPSPAKKKKTRAPRNVQSYEQKMHCMDASILRTFLKTGKCGCGKKCIWKLRSHGEKGAQVTSNLRRVRFAGILSADISAFLVLFRAMFLTYNYKRNI